MLLYRLQFAYTGAGHKRDFGAMDVQADFLPRKGEWIAVRDGEEPYEVADVLHSVTHGIKPVVKVR